MSDSHTLFITIETTNVVIAEVEGRTEALRLAEAEEARRGRHVAVIPTPAEGEPVTGWSSPED